MIEPIFYLDVGSPFVYLAAERIDALFSRPVHWQPVLLGGLFKLTGRSSWAIGDYQRRQRGMAEIERRAREYGLPALRWPDPWPGDYLTAMRVATYAFAQGDELGRAYVLAAGRALFQQGRDLSISEEVFGAAAAAGLDPIAARAAVGDREVKVALREATDAAHRAGVFGVPTLTLGDDLYWGDDRLGAAATAVSAAWPQG